MQILFDFVSFLSTCVFCFGVSSRENWYRSCWNFGECIIVVGMRKL